jgi:dihydroorotase
MQTLSLRRPDDWHVHFRDGDLLAAVAPFTAAVFARAIVMPNLTPPVTTAAMALAYRKRIETAIPADFGFTPLMTCYLTDATDARDLVEGHRAGILTAAKLYPAHATTNSQHGVTAIERIHSVLEAMEEAQMPLLVHGEVARPEVDVFDRELAFIDQVLVPMLERFPGLRVVLEHVTTAEGVAAVRAYRGRVAGTITPQHLLFNRNALFQGGIRPHMYCLPVLKREQHRRALREAATSGDPSFFLGTDTAPHLKHLKEAACGCAGVFNAPVALAAYAKVFEEEGALEKLEAFASLNGPAFYRLPANTQRIELRRVPQIVPDTVDVEKCGGIVPLYAGEQVDWTVFLGSSAGS